MNYEASKLIVSIKGNGLLAIEDRIEKLGGKVDYIFEDNCGFEVLLVL